jgi:hypothetical protein
MDYRIGFGVGVGERVDWGFMGSGSGGPVESIRQSVGDIVGNCKEQSQYSHNFTRWPATVIDWGAETRTWY